MASLAYARIQGKSALVSHFQNSSLMNEDKRCRPILFHSDGPNAGDQVCSLLVHLSLLSVASWYMTICELYCSVYKSGLSLKYASLNTLVTLSWPCRITTRYSLALFQHWLPYKRHCLQEYYVMNIISDSQCLYFLVAIILCLVSLL